MDSTNPSAFIRGLLPSVDWADGSRIPSQYAAKLPVDTVKAGRVPAGVHLAFTSTASALELDVEVGPPTSAPAPTLASTFTVWNDDRFIRRIDIPDAGGTVTIPLGDGVSDGLTRIYLPEPVEVRLTGMRAVGGSITPAPERPRLVAYGDSITQGWSVSEAGKDWPSLVAAQLGLESVNFGFAGSARGEIFAAAAVAESQADVVTIAWGTNAWSAYPTDAEHIASTMRLFLKTIRQGLPDVPIIVVSPIVRPDAEAQPNRYGATQADLRTAIENAVERSAADDDRITLVQGLGIVDAARLPDGLHPDDDGAAVMAAAIVPIVAAGLDGTDASPNGHRSGLLPNVQGA